MERFTKMIQQQRDHAHNRIAFIVTNRMEDAMKAFKLRYPKRTIENGAGMGTFFFVVDDAILTIDHSCGKLTVTHPDFFFINSTDKAIELFSDLVNFESWLCDISENHEYLDLYINNKYKF